MLAKRSASRIFWAWGHRRQICQREKKNPRSLEWPEAWVAKLSSPKSCERFRKQEPIANPCGDLCARGKSSVKEQQSAHV